MRRGEIYLADLNSHVGSVQQGIRPVVIVQNDVGNAYSPTTVACPLTTSQTKSRVATHVELTPKDSGVLKDSIVLCEQIMTLDKQQLRKKLGEVNNRQKMEDINKGLLISIGIGGDKHE